MSWSGRSSTNISTSAPLGAKYSRVGSVVTVSIAVNIQATVSETDSTLAISLPIASVLVSTYSCIGASVIASSTYDSAYIIADTTNDRALLRCSPPTNAIGYKYYLTFQYEII